MRTPAWCRKQAAAVGPACEQVIADLLADNALYRLRAAQGVVGLADRHDPSRLEAACAKAIAAGDPSYRTIKGILAAGTDREPARRRCGRGRRRRRVLARPGVVRQRRGHARHDHQRRAGHARRGRRHLMARHGHDRPGGMIPARPLAAQAHALLAAAVFIEQRRDHRADLAVGSDRITILVPADLAGPAARTAAVAALAAAGAAGTTAGTGLGHRRRDLAGHPARVFAPTQDTPMTARHRHRPHRAGRQRCAP